jgi:hypothetical protein
MHEVEIGLAERGGGFRPQCRQYCQMTLNFGGICAILRVDFETEWFFPIQNPGVKSSKCTASRFEAGPTSGLNPPPHGARPILTAMANKKDRHLSRPHN